MIMILGLMKVVEIRIFENVMRMRPTQ